MTGVRLTKFEMQIMDSVWTRGEASIREMQEAFPVKKRPGYTTVQKMVYRIGGKEYSPSRTEGRKLSRIRANGHTCGSRA